MKDFQTILMHISLVGAIALTCIFITIVCKRQIAFIAAQLLEKWRRVCGLGRALLAIFVTAMIVYGSTKTNQTNNAGDGSSNTNQTNGADGNSTNTPPMMGMSPPVVPPLPSGAQGSPSENDIPQPDPSLIPEGATLAQNWWRRGGWEDWRTVSFDDGWVFPHGTNHLMKVTVMSQGALRTRLSDTNEIVTLGVPLAMVPFETVFTHGRTPSNSYAFTWTRAYANREANFPVNASIELFRNGDVAVVTNGVTTAMPRVIPFSHDGFGQDDDWVRANFTNAAEILSVGYSHWVDAQVGVCLTNGLYKFTATFTNAPPEATLLTVADYSVCVTNAGVYSFVLEKGVEYELGTWPFDAGVWYHMQDDLDSDATDSSSACDGAVSDGEWSVGGGQCLFSNPTANQRGSCRWLPTLRGSPNISHLGTSGFPVLFEAILSDYCGSAQPRYQWSASTDDIEFVSPNTRATTATCSSFPEWCTCTLTLQADIGGYSLWSDLYFSYGTNDEPRASFSMNAPEIVFLNDDDRTSRWYAVSLKLSCPVETNATISIVNDGLTGMRFSTDPTGSNAFSPGDIRLCVSGEAASTTFYCSCTNLGSGTLRASCALPSGEVLRVNREYRVIEPLRKLVSTVVADDGSYVNPSRLVYGTNAWLQVDQNGHFPSCEIKWRVVSGPGELVVTNCYRACVRPTASSGTVVVEAAFGSDALVQPRFVLPIAEKRTIAVKACIVADDAGVQGLTEQDVDRKIEDANVIFSQIGLELYRPSPVQVITNSHYLVIEEYSLVTNSLGGVALSKHVSAKAMNLASQVVLTDGECVKLIWVDGIVHGTPIAFTMSNEHCCIIANGYLRASNSILAHEIGHVLGLSDVYGVRKRSRDQLPEGMMPLHVEVFSEWETDWVGDDGRGFYEVGDIHLEMLESLLMYGWDTGGGDIPSGAVSGFTSESRNIFDVKYVSVGASFVNEGGK